MPKEKMFILYLLDNPQRDWTHTNKYDLMHYPGIHREYTQYSDIIMDPHGVLSVIRSSVHQWCYQV